MITRSDSFGAFVDAIDSAGWDDLGIAPAGAAEGAPAYHPRLLLSVWLYGFMTGVRSSRKLEAACCDQLPYLWLTGFQKPDHNTLCASTRPTARRCACS